jgi:anti-sigma regulatory factor (Ser/Thr protein kinase)
MPRTALNDVTRWITEAALHHPHDLTAHAAQRLGLARNTAQRLLRRLVELNWLVRQGSSRRPHHVPGLLRQVVQRYALDGLQEDLPWARDFAPYFDLPDEVARMAQHGFTELLNNAIEHSGGSQVTVSMRQTPLQLQLLVSDDGRGIFETIGEAFGINDPVLAMLELAKGKLSSRPDQHSGRGLFYTAKLADVFDLHANNAAFQQRDWQRDEWQRGRPACTAGSAVYVAICLDTERTLDSVLRRYSLDRAGYGFERTVVPLRLITAPQQGLSSRAQARRVVARLGQFRRAELDFAGLVDVGPAFADELFRVFGGRHPGVQLVPLNMSPRVAEMVAACSVG